MQIEGDKYKRQEKISCTDVMYIVLDINIFFFLLQVRLLRIYLS